MILHLTLKKKWFDMIASGEKKEEYRELKDYWQNRLQHFDIVERNCFSAFKNYTEFKHFDIIRFTNGYGKNAPSFDIECKGISIGPGNPAWGGSDLQFVISLGDIVSEVNNRIGS